jgi:hypothetical protein
MKASAHKRSCQSVITVQPWGIEVENNLCDAIEQAKGRRSQR